MVLFQIQYQILTLFYRNHNQVQPDHQELMVFPVTMELMEFLAHLDHRVHQDLLEVQVPEE